MEAVEIHSWGVPIKAWTQGVQVEDAAIRQLQNIAALPFIHDHVAVMPDVHFGIGATVGSVIPAYGAIIPAAVGVDIGCGMIAQRTSLTASDLPESLLDIRIAIEEAVPHGGPGTQAGWGSRSGTPGLVFDSWRPLQARLKKIQDKHKAINGNDVIHLGTLGGGNHFIELCLDKEDRVWIMLHSGSRGIGNRIGTYFIQRAREALAGRGIKIPDVDLAWLAEGESDFDDYLEAVQWAQDYAKTNRLIMMDSVIKVLRKKIKKPFSLEESAVNCHHNYVNKEHHYGKDVWVTRKGAVSAQLDQLGIIPGSMGARSFIVRGLGNKESFCSCSHGAGRKMSRGEAKRTFTVADHELATAGIECRKDASVIDETPGAYKSIEAVMAAQSSLVEIVFELRQVVCVKG